MLIVLSMLLPQRNEEIHDKQDADLCFHTPMRSKIKQLSNADVLK